MMLQPTLSESGHIILKWSDVPAIVISGKQSFSASMTYQTLENPIQV